jgi:hypothetical protein
MEVIYEKEAYTSLSQKEYQFCSLALWWKDQDTLKCSVTTYEHDSLGTMQHLPYILKVYFLNYNQCFITELSELS